MGTQIGRLLHICAERNIHCNRSVSGYINPQASGKLGSGTVGRIALRSVLVLVGERAYPQGFFCHYPDWGRL
jgi:hypothetical protein